MKANNLLTGAGIRRSFVPSIMAAVLTGLALPAMANDITIQPDEDDSKDSFVYSFLTSWAFDTDSSGSGAAFGDLLSAGATTSGAHDLVSYLQFDLTDLENLDLHGTDIDEALLYVYVESSSTVGFGGDPSASFPIGVTAYKVDSSWTESTLTWANGPSYSTVAGTATINSTGYWTYFTVTSTVRNWLDGVYSNNGFALEQNSPVSDGTSQIVGVFQSSAGAHKPYLKVTY